ncbi:MAG: Fic family protein [Burkholderiaceae bacterium]|nr:Fic family protein [Burkholderiaceae bacterium]
MEQLHEDLRGALEDLDKAAIAADGPLVGRFFLVRLIQILAATMVRFFTIHPYANGNGHMGRLLVWSALGLYNRLPVRWWLDRSPPEYGPLIDAHRAGNAKPLEKYLMKCIIG